MTWSSEDRSLAEGPCRSPAGGGGPLELVGRMFLLPMALVVSGAELATWSVRELQRLADEGVDRIFGHAPSPAPRAVPAVGGPVAVSVEATGPTGGEGLARAPGIVNHGAVATAADSRREERGVMSDTNLADDMVKLVRYTIVSIKRDDEQILKRDEEIFDDNMTDDGFATWVISKYGDAQALGSDDRKYLRVSYEVLDRWPRQDRKFEKRQLEVLEGIRKAL